MAFESRCYEYMIKYGEQLTELWPTYKQMRGFFFKAKISLSLNLIIMAPILLREECFYFKINIMKTY
jgi:hypothetical protein